MTLTIDSTLLGARLAGFGSGSAGIQCIWMGTYFPVPFPVVWPMLLVNSPYDPLSNVYR